MSNMPTRYFDMLYKNGFSTANLRYLTNKNIVTQCHNHDYYEFFLALYGSITHVINGKSKTIEAGRLYLIRPQDQHYFIRNRHIEFKSVNIAFPQSIYNEIVDYSASGPLMSKLTSSPHEVSVQLDNDGLSHLEGRIDILRTAVTMDKATEASLYRLLLSDMMYFLIRKGLFRETSKSDWIETLHSKLTRKAYFARGTDCIVELTGRSYEHSARVFKQRYHTTLSRYINDIRITYAENMLLRTDEDICDIAMEAGYNSMSYFYAQFKAHHQLSPAEFRQKHMVNV
jgi:AraC family cel operon transcriptional repressor